MCKIRSWHFVCILLGVFSALLVSCGSGSESNVPTLVQPTSTTSPLFLEPETSTPIARELTTATPTATRRPNPTVIPETTPTVEPIDTRYTTVDIYDEQLLSNWTLKNSANVKYRDDFTGYSYAGKKSIVSTPKSFGQLQFSLSPSSKIAYKRDEVAGVSFWISSADQLITPEDFTIAVLGSNDYKYWVANDTSVKVTGRVTDNSPIFSETRLSFLNIKRTIEPKTWTEVIVWLDDLLYEPDYNYVTGFYIKNDAQFQGTFYIDNVSLILNKK